MKINGVYVGLGEGDRSPEIVKLKALLKQKFTPARNTLDDGDLFTTALTVEVQRIQGIYTAEGKPGAPYYISGVVNLEFKYDVGLLQRPQKVLPIIFTVEGHLSNMFMGPCAQVASLLESQGLVHWKPIGYNSEALPFDNPSGVRALEIEVGSTQIAGPPGVMWPFPAGTPWGIVGFSQGAMVISDFMEQKVLTGPLNWRLDSFKRGLAFGNPRREKDAVCSWAMNPPDPGTQGIMDKPFNASKTAIASRWAEHPNDQDMFAENDPTTAAGKDKTAIARIITENSWLGGPTAIFSRVLSLFGNPVGEGFAAIKAIFDAIMFLASNPNPHYSTVSEPGDVDWMRGVAA